MHAQGGSQGSHNVALNSWELTYPEPETIAPDCKMQPAKPLPQWAGKTSQTTTKAMVSKPANIDY